MKKARVIIPTICFAVLSTPAFEKAVSAAEQAAPVKKATLTSYLSSQYVDVNPGSYLNLRKSASTNSEVIGRLTNGAEVNVYSEENGWAKVKANGKDGYVSTKYLSPYNINTTIPEKTTTKYVNVDPGSRLNLRQSASTNSAILAMLSNGTKVTVYSETGGWAKVKANDKEGYVSTRYLVATVTEATSNNQKKVQEPVTKYVSVNPGSHLNLRKNASTTSAVISKLDNGTAVTVHSETGGWAKVTANGKEGYVSTRYLGAAKSGDNANADKSGTTESSQTVTKYVAVNPGSNLNLRSSASTGSTVISKLPNGAEVTVYSEAGGWAKVKANGKEGFVSTAYLTAGKSAGSDNSDKPGNTTKPQQPEKVTTVTKYVSVNDGSNLNLRKSASTSSSILSKLPNGTQVTVYSEAGGWAKVKANGKEGYVSTAYLTAGKSESDNSNKPENSTKPTEPEKVTTLTKYVSVNQGSNLNLRKGASTGSAVISKLPNGTVVTVYSEENGWAKVKANGKEGYVSTEFLASSKPDSSITTEVMYVDVLPGSNLNMRNKPSTNGSVIVKLARGVEVTVYSVNNGWAKIEVYGQEGYVSTEFLSEIKPGSGAVPEPDNQPNPDETETPGTEPDTNPGHNDSDSGTEPDNDQDTAPDDEPDTQPDDGSNPDDSTDVEPDPSEETEVTPPTAEPEDDTSEDKPVVKLVNVDPGSNLNLRSGPSTSTAIITRLPAGTEVIVHSEESGWAYVTAKGRTGYVSTQYLLSVPDKTPDLPGEKITTVHQDYDISLDELVDIQMKANPQTDQDYAVFIREDALKVDNSSNPTSGTVQGTGWRVRGGAGTDYWAVGQVNNGEKLQILSVVEGNDGYDWYQIQYNKNWVNPSRDDVRYYADPNNFLNSSAERFQFLKLSTTANLDPFEVNEQLLSGKGALAGHGATFTTAAKKYGINEIYLISHALLETGNGKSALAQGVQIYGKTVYNMYGIGATDSNPIGNGAQYAYEAGWFTPEAAIIGGAQFIAQNYIFSGQDTLYKMRWNPNGAVAYGKATHQYATDIGWAVKQVYRIFGLYNQLNTYQVILEIPKYK